jgi:hypothetical protein
MKGNCVKRSENLDERAVDSSLIIIFHLFFLMCLTNNMKPNNRDKAIQSFQAILNKYDVEVGEERTRELEELRNALELQRKEFALWRETVAEPQMKL